MDRFDVMRASAFVLWRAGPYDKVTVRVARSVEMIVSRISDQHGAEQDPKKARKPWVKPELRKMKLTGGELAALHQSDDPQGLLRKMWSDLKGREEG